jgi:DNA-binding MurR/RpiR family transcriptional regulator
MAVRQSVTTTATHNRPPAEPAPGDPPAGPGARRRDRPDRSNPLVRIRSLLPGLARAEQRVAQVVLGDPAAVAHHSITEVAESAGTSETTVTRFCKAVGLGGYPELRLALAAETARTAARSEPDLGSTIDSSDPLDQVVRKVAYADARAIEETARQLDTTELAAVARLMAAAGRIEIYGVGPSSLIAQDFQHKLHRIHRVAFAHTDPLAALGSAALLGPGDVAIGISHTGSTMDTIELLREARRHGATTVALTNFPRSPITEVADHVLTTATRETTFRSGPMASRIAQLTVIDCLFIGIAQQHDEASRAALELTRTALAGRRMDPRPESRRRGRREHPPAPPGR